MHFVGVDAGGTKTAFILCDEKGSILAEHRAEGGGFITIGAEGVRRTVAGGVDVLCARAGIARGEITWAGVGFPGYGEMDGAEALILDACRAALGSDRVTCECDCYLGWAGSLALMPGINIVAGTGSICYGVSAAGESARSGGWGAFCDEGSCTWIGGRLIAAFAKQADGRRPRTRLYPMFREAMEIDKDEHFIHPLNHEIATKRGEAARIQVVAERIARAGDPVARVIYDEAAGELCEAIVAVRDKLAMGDGFAVSYSGGLFRSGDCILTPLRARVAEAGGTLVAPRFPPEIGAVLMAMRAYDPGMALPEAFG